MEYNRGNPRRSQMNKRPVSKVHTSDAPEPVGAYSQAVRAGGLLFLSGQIGIDPETGELADGVEMQAAQALENLRAVAGAAGVGMDRIVKVTLFLTDIGDFPLINGIYSGYFTEPFPARAALGVAALPLGARVEIEAIAMLPEDAQ
jgi:2-iminobutanoate/2-iminopropanoate deaminase